MACYRFESTIVNEFGNTFTSSQSPHSRTTLFVTCWRENINSPKERMFQDKRVPDLRPSREQP